MWEILEIIENSGFATFVRETPSVLGYSTVLALHTFGMAFLVGLSGVIALQVLGVVRGLPLAPLEAFFPLIIAGFWVNAATGVVLTMLAARSLAANPDFYVKLIAIVAAVICLRKLKQYAFSDAAAGDLASAQCAMCRRALLSPEGQQMVAAVAESLRTRDQRHVGDRRGHRKQRLRHVCARNA